jgi:hypothetical protein
VYFLDYKKKLGATSITKRRLSLEWNEDAFFEGIKFLAVCFIDSHCAVYEFVQSRPAA